MDCLICDAEMPLKVICTRCHEQRIADLEKVVERLRFGILAILESEPGIYPKSVVGKYEKRSERQEGWNEAVCADSQLRYDVIAACGIDINSDEFADEMQEKATELVLDVWHKQDDSVRQQYQKIESLTEQLQRAREILKTEPYPIQKALEVLEEGE